MRPLTRPRVSVILNHMKQTFLFACDAVVRWSLYGALFFTPLFFLPLTLYPVDLNKQALLTALVFLGAIAWLIKAVVAGKFECARSQVDILLASLAAFAGISAFFSGARAIGFMGVTGGEIDTVLAMVTFALFYFLVTATFHNKEDAKRAFTALLASASFIVALVALQIVGARLFPWDFTRVAGFNPVGTTNAVGLYFGFIFTLAFAGAYYGVAWGKNLRIWCGIMAGLLFVGAFLVGYWAVFFGLVVSLLVLITLNARALGAKVSSQRNLLPIALIVVCIFMITVSFGIISLPLPRMNVPMEIAPSVPVSWDIVRNTARESVKNFLLGSGPATYQYQYGKHRPAAFNQTNIWNVEFSQGFNAILTHLVSWGVVGTVLFLLFLTLFIAEIIRLIRGRRGSDAVYDAFVASGAYSVVILFLYPQNFTLYFLLFVSAGIVTATYAARREVLCKAFSWSLGIMLVVMAFVAVSYVNGRRFVGAAQFARGIVMARATGTVEKALPLLAVGIALDPQNDMYLQVFSDALLMRANAEAVVLEAQGGTPSRELHEKIIADISAAVAAAERSTQVNPSNVANWLGLARTYEAVMAIRPDAAQDAFTAYAVAARLQPNNPAIPVGLGVARMAYADRLPKEKRGVEYQAALSAFEQALSLKSDYASAHFALVQVFDREGRSAEAVARAERLRSLAPRDAGILFQLGLLHYQAGRFAKAQTAFEDATRQSPDYANALYFLGLTHDKLGDRPAALGAFQRVAQLNPDNKDITAIIENIRNNRPALSSGAEARPLEEKSIIAPARPR